MNEGVVIMHRGHKITPTQGGWIIAGYEKSVFVTVEMAKQHIQMMERPTPDRFVMVNGQPYELSKINSVSLMADGKYGLSVSYKAINPTLR